MNSDGKNGFLRGKAVTLKSPVFSGCSLT